MKKKNWLVIVSIVLVAAVIVAALAIVIGAAIVALTQSDDGEGSIIENIFDAISGGSQENLSNVSDTATSGEGSTASSQMPNNSDVKDEADAGIYDTEFEGIEIPE